ncbi:hypothetical protein [Streptomyces sp. NPDC000994]
MTVTGKQAVDRLDSAVYTVPTDGPEADGTFAWDSTTLVLATVRCGDVTGLGYTYAPAATARAVDDLLADVVTGTSILDVPYLNEAMQRAVRNAGLPGIAALAVSAVDIALWDAKARMLGLPLVQLIARRARLPVLGSCPVSVRQGQGASGLADDGRAEDEPAHVRKGVPSALKRYGWAQSRPQRGQTRSAGMNSTVLGSKCTLSSRVGGVVSLVRSRSPAFMADRVPRLASPTVRSERPCTGLNQTGTETARPVTGPGCLRSNHPAFPCDAPVTVGGHGHDVRRAT